MEAYDEKCEGCTHARPIAWGAYCRSSAVPGIYAFRAAPQHVMRANSGPCGPSACLFEPKANNAGEPKHTRE